MLKIKNINQKTAVLSKENIAQSKIQILNYLIYNLWGSQDLDTVHSAFVSLYACIYVSKALYWELQNTKIEMMPNLWCALLKSIFSTFMNGEYFWPESRSHGINLGMWVQKSIHIQRTSGPGASFTCINNANYFSLRRQKVLMGTKLVTRWLQDLIKIVNEIKTMVFPWDCCLASVSICETDNHIHTIISDAYLQTWIFLTEYKRMSTNKVTLL